LKGSSRLDENSLRRGLRTLARSDAHVAAALERYGYPQLRRSDAGFAGLLRAIVAQQLSSMAARTIWQRVQALATPFTAESFCCVDEGRLRAAGLSRQKIAYARELADSVACGRVPIDTLGTLDDEAAIAVLTAIKGIGRWTAEVYLLFALGRPDIWPADDLALIIGMQRMKGLRQRPSRAKMLQLGEAWRPWRGAGAHLLWHYYHQLRAPAPKPMSVSLPRQRLR
jgi:DNA-3-methyladenine glycosylase II